MKKIAQFAAWLAAATLSANASASLLIGAATLATNDDLTVVERTGGAQLQFLDLTTTYKMSINQAVAAYGAQGFRVANNLEMEDLYGAFHMTYAGVTMSSPEDPVDIQGFIDYLGDIFFGPYKFHGNSGLFMDGTVNLSCVNGCTGPNTLHVMTATGWTMDQQLGDGSVFLVRDTPVVAAALPEPTSAALAGIALLGCAGAWQRRRSATHRHSSRLAR